MNNVFTRIDTVFLPVRDLSLALDWYTRVLGLELRWRDGSYACLGVGETPLTLFESSHVNGSEHERFNFFTPDIESAHQNLDRNGVKVGPITHPSPALKFFVFSDPDGNVLAACQW